MTWSQTHSEQASLSSRSSQATAQGLSKLAPQTGCAYKPEHHSEKADFGFTVFLYV